MLVVAKVDGQGPFDHLVQAAQMLTVVFWYYTHGSEASKG